MSRRQCHGTIRRGVEDRPSVDRRRGVLGGRIPEVEPVDLHHASFPRQLYLAARVRFGARRGFVDRLERDHGTRPGIECSRHGGCRAQHVDHHDDTICHVGGGDLRLAEQHIDAH